MFFCLFLNKVVVSIVCREIGERKPENWLTSKCEFSFTCWLRYHAIKWKFICISNKITMRKSQYSNRKRNLVKLITLNRVRSLLFEKFRTFQIIDQIFLFLKTKAHTHTDKGNKRFVAAVNLHLKSRLIYGAFWFGNLHNARIAHRLTDSDVKMVIFLGSLFHHFFLVVSFVTLRFPILFSF